MPHHAPHLWSVILYLTKNLHSWFDAPTYSYGNTLYLILSNYPSLISNTHANPTISNHHLISFSLVHPHHSSIRSHHVPLHKWNYSMANIDGLIFSTQKTYSSAAHRFHDFRAKFNVLTPFPISEQLLTCFAAFPAEEGLKEQLIKTYLAALCYLQV